MVTNNNNWCAFCANQRLCDNENCKICHDKSFESNPRSIYWSSRNTDSPRSVFKSIDKKRWFICEKNHEFCSKLLHISAGSWCPLCTNKTEGKLYNWLRELYPTAESQKYFSWAKSKKTRYYRVYDFYIKEHNVIIELDGRGHFMQVSNWTSPEENKINDDLKNKMALENGINMIRICQEDVWFNRDNWDSNLKYCIEKLTDIPAVYKIGDVYKNEETNLTEIFSEKLNIQ